VTHWLGRVTQYEKTLAGCSKGDLLTRRTLAVTSPAHPESAKTDSPPRDAPFRWQGRSEEKPEEAHTATRVGRSPLQWVLAKGKAPLAFPTSEKRLLPVEGLNDARTLLANYFSILLSRKLHPSPAFAKVRLMTHSLARSLVLAGASGLFLPL